MNTNNFFVIIILIIDSITANGQIRCGKYPTFDVVYEQLKNKPVKINYKKLTPNCNVNDSIRNRLLYLLIPKWTQFEIDNYATKKVADYDKRINYQATNISNGNDSIFKVAKDSIINLRKVDYINEKDYNPINGVDGSILQAVSYLDIKEAVPILRKYFKSYNIDLTKLSLARLGDKGYQKEIIMNSMPDTSLYEWKWIEDLKNKGAKLSFIGTQESIYAYSHWIDTSKMWHQSHHSQGVKAANQVLIFLKDIILNEDFQTKFKYTFPERSELYDANYDNIDILMYCKNWLIKNKGKYKIKRSFYEW